MCKFIHYIVTVLSVFCKSCVYISGSGRQTGKYQIDVNMIGEYEVQYSTSRKFDSPQTITIKDRKSCSETIKDLREGEKYYVRVRALTFVGDGDGYIRSGWSRTKSRKAG